jgi:hypothetical protein
MEVDASRAHARGLSRSTPISNGFGETRATRIIVGSRAGALVGDQSSDCGTSLRSGPFT